MKRRANLIVYIILNIIVSTVTMLRVLWFWNRAQKANLSPDIVTASNCPAVVSGDATPLPELKVIEISNVIGVGSLENEMVLLTHVGEEDISLKNWKLIDEHGNQLTFPALTFSKGELHIYTRQGIDTALELFWNLQQPIWQTGEKVRVLDPQGNERASYTIP
jgi:hypothetical protein